jgi:hypothetical protein
MTTLESSVQIPDDVLFRDLSGEGILLNLATGKYFRLDQVGTRMWVLLAEKGQIRAAYRALLEEFDVDEDRLHQDLLVLVDKLASHGLVVVKQSTDNNKAGSING